jgi:CheY-like chemotaxis protein
MTTSIASPPAFNLLLVEDSEDDVLLTKHAFKNLPVAISFQVARDAIEALKVLRREPPYADAPRPQLILLDLNMPRMDGRQLLIELKRDEQLKTIPVVILTTSAADEDVLNAYRSYASAYMTKPLDIHEFALHIERFTSFWLGGAAVLPPELKVWRLQNT